MYCIVVIIRNIKFVRVNLWWNRGWFWDEGVLSERGYEWVICCVGNFNRELGGYYIDVYVYKNLSYILKIC